MTFFSILSWDAFSSGWFWSLFIIQLLPHWFYIFGIPVRFLKTANVEVLEPYILLRLSRRNYLSDKFYPLAVIFWSALMTSTLLLGFLFKLEFFQALSLIIVPQIFIIFMTNRDYKKLTNYDFPFAEKILIINKLHEKIKWLVVFTVLLFTTLNFRYGMQPL